MNQAFDKDTALRALNRILELDLAGVIAEEQTHLDEVDKMLRAPGQTRTATEGV